MNTNLLNPDAAQLTAFFAGIGEKPFRAKQLLRWMHQYGEADFSKMSDLAKSLRENSRPAPRSRFQRVTSDATAADGTRKWLIDVGNGNAVESVFIPEPNRGTLCVSSQAGCALDCKFCSTGKQGFNRNLSTAEIIGQLWIANKALGAPPPRANASSATWS